MILQEDAHKLENSPAHEGADERQHNALELHDEELAPGLDEDEVDSLLDGLKEIFLPLSPDIDDIIPPASAATAADRDDSANSADFWYFGELWSFPG